jgi:hypothetical protein
MKRTLDALFIVLAVVVGAVYLTLFLFPGSAAVERLLTAERTLVFAALVKLLFLALGTWFATRAVAAFEAGNPARPAWRLFGAGLGLYLLGQGTLARYQVLRLESAPFPSLADVFFVAGTVAFVAALLAFIVAYQRAGLPVAGRRHLLLAVVAGLALLALLGAWILRPVVLAPAPFWTKAVDLTYPLLDAVLLVANLVLLDLAARLRGGRVWKVWASLLAGFLFTAAGDILFSFFSALGIQRLDPLAHLTFAYSYLFLALAPRYQSEIAGSR